MKITKTEIRAMIMEELQSRVAAKKKSLQEAKKPVAKTTSKTNSLQESLRAEVRRVLMEELFSSK